MEPPHHQGPALTSGEAEARAKNLPPLAMVQV